MRFGVIDVGSNSVRLMLSENGHTLKKEIIITRLAEGLAETWRLSENAINRTISAIGTLKRNAEHAGVSALYVFATAAVRSAKNGSEFVQRTLMEQNVLIEVIDGATEAQIGLLGALGNREGGVLDIGGASSELIVSLNGKIVYEYSLNLGAVRLLDLCGQSREALSQLIGERIKEYGSVPSVPLTAIGGTATSIASVDLKLEPYDPLRVDGHVLMKERLSSLVELLFSLSVEERKSLKGLQPQRADVIAGGALLLLSIMEYLQLSEITVSERDNLEGFLLRKTDHE